jgi:hypothetical protein
LYAAYAGRRKIHMFDGVRPEPFIDRRLVGEI